MKALVPLLAIVIYPLLMLARVIGNLSGKDPLRLREPGRDSLWIERPVRRRATDYFRDDSPVEAEMEDSGDRSLAGVAGFIMPLYGVIASAAGPKSADNASAVLDEEDIPDAIYTLW